MAWVSFLKTQSQWLKKAISFCYCLTLVHVPPVTKIVWPPKGAVSILTFTLHNSLGPRLSSISSAYPLAFPVTCIYNPLHLCPVHDIKYISTRHSWVDHCNFAQTQLSVEMILVKAGVDTIPHHLIQWPYWDLRDVIQVVDLAPVKMNLASLKVRKPLSL